jgi:ribonuclease D
LCKAVFGKNPPDDLNLAALTRYLLGFNLNKLEQSSVWSYRPLRQAQQRYAAEDSHAVVELTKRFTKTITE